MADFLYEDLLPIGADATEYRLLTTEGVSTVEDRTAAPSCRSSPRRCGCSPRRRCTTSRTTCARRTSRSCASILDDPEASANDKFVALDLLKNANIAAGRRAADVPGHRHRDRHGQARPARAHPRRRRGGDRPRRVRRLHHG